MPDSAPRDPTCANCRAPLAGGYCAQCGQKVAPVNPSFRDLLHDVVHEFLHVDGKIFRSIRLLFTRPGFLSREYFLGRRARYVSPIRLYLIFSVMFFAVTAGMSESRPTFRPDETAEVGAIGALLGLEDLAPGEANELVDQAQTTWLPRVMFVLVPFCALLVQAVTRRSGKNYPQHLYFALHAHAAYFAVLSATALMRTAPVGPLNLVLALVPVVFLVTYSVIAFHTAYAGRWRLAIGRTAFVLVTYMVVVGLSVAVMMVLVLRA